MMQFLKTMKIVMAYKDIKCVTKWDGNYVINNIQKVSFHNIVASGDDAIIIATKMFNITHGLVV